MAEIEGGGWADVRAANAAKGKSDSECVQVVVRCRPLSKTELENKCKHIVDVDNAANQVTIKNPDGGAPKMYTFDGAFDEKTQQRHFYDEACFTLVESILEGFNATVFAYGQTGCGKSFSMQGPPAPPAPPEMRGVIPNAFAHLFEYIQCTEGTEFLVRCSYLEIYNEEVRDLLDTKTDKKCDIRENKNKGVFVNNLSEVVVDTAAKIQAVLDKGLGGRTVASTLMNSESSRSHSIFTIVIEMSSIEPDTGRELLRAGKLNLVDLAGSERQKKTGASGDILKEGAKINLSLTSLGNVIQALTEAREHVPYRDSKLTRLLQDSLGGNTKTLMIAAISPADYNYDETLSTLRYANRAKNIKNKPKINEDPKDTLLRTYKEEIERLKRQLEEFKSNAGEGNLDVGALNNMVKMLSGEAVDSNRITHADDEAGDTESATGNAGSEMNFAAFAGGGGSDKNSPRADLTPIQESPNRKTSPRLHKDQTPEKLRQPSQNGANHDRRDNEHLHMLAAEHDYVHGQLKEREQEVQEEKLRVAEMAAKLQQLEGQLMVNMHAHAFGGSTKMGNSVKVAEETKEDVAEREAARKAYLARKAALKAKRDAKKIKARTEKQEFEREREYLLDNLREQSRNLQEETRERMLYEQIVYAVLSRKDLKRVLDKCRWNDDAMEWTLPALKQKSAGDMFVLPDINRANVSADEGGYAVSSSIDNSNIPSQGWQGTTMVLPNSINGSRGGAPNSGRVNSRGFSPRLGDQMPNQQQFGSVPPLESQTPRSRVQSGRRITSKDPNATTTVLPAAVNDPGYGTMENGPGSNGNSKPPRAKGKGKKRKQKNANREPPPEGNSGEAYSDWGFTGVPNASGDESAYSDDDDFDDEPTEKEQNAIAFSQFAQIGEENDPSSDVIPKKKNRKVKDDGVSPSVSPRAPQLFPSLK